MKKLTSVVIVLSLLLLVCICIPQFSDAQKLKSGVKGITKPGISKPTAKKPGLSKSIKSQLPALEVSRLTLDSGCKITGFLQNKGSKMDAGHPDFSKLQIKVGYTLNGKTIEVLLETRPGGTATQPRLLKGVKDLRNFTQGKPAKFTSKLKVLATGKGFATVFAEIDPNNRIRETRAGEQRKLIQARLRFRCLGRGADTKRVKPIVTNAKSTIKKRTMTIDPKIKKKAKIKAPYSSFSDNMVTKGDGDPVGIIVLSPSTMQIVDLTRENTHIPVEFEYVHPPGDEARVLTFRFIAYNESGEMEEDKNVSNPDGWRTSGDIVTEGGTLNLSMRGIPKSDLIYNYKYRLQITCHSNVGVVAQGFSGLFVIRDFRYRTERVEGIRFISPTIDQHIPQNEAISVEYRYMSQVEGVVYTTFILMGFDRTGDHSRVTGPSWNRRSGFDSNGGSFEIPWDQIPASYLLYDHYKILIACYGGGNVLAEGMSESFTLWGSYYDPLPVPNGISITSPASGDVIYIGETIDIQFNNTLIPRHLEGARFLFWISKIQESDVSLKSVYEPIPSDGSATLSTSGIRIGKYQIHGKAINSRGRDLAPGISGSSEVFRLENRRRSMVDHGPGIDVILPTATNVGPSGKINVRFEGGCDGATHRIITLHHLYYTSHADESYELDSLPMMTSYTRYAQQFDIPAGCFDEDPTGDNSSFVIGVQGGYLDSAGNFVSLGSTCHGYSESFRLTR